MRFWREAGGTPRARWVALAALAGGCLMQTGTCSLNPDTLGQIANEVIIQQVGNLLTDTVFFLLDNALVRLSV